MRYIDCCKSTRKNKKCTRKDGKHFSLQRRFTKKKCIKGPVKGFTMRASCAPYKFCKQKGGTRKNHNKGKEDFKYNPFYTESKFKVGDNVKMNLQLNDNECIFYTYMDDKLTHEKCRELHNDKWKVTKVEEGLGSIEYMYSIKNKDDIELSVRPQNTLSKWNETSNSRIMSIGGKYNKKISKKQRGGSDPEEKTQLPNLQQSADILRSSLGIHRQGQNAMWENQVIRLALEGDERFTHLLGEEPLIAQKEQDPQDGGRVTRRRRRRKKRKKKTRKKKKQFLYNPNDPSKSFDVYIDKNPKDTIPIKYTTVKDVKDTIKKLEGLFKTKKYPHKRIWQVGMIMKVRLEAMLKHKTKKYPNAKKVKQRFNLANKYFKFLGKRTKKKDFKSRKAMTFKL